MCCTDFIANTALMANDNNKAKKMEPESENQGHTETMRENANIFMLFAQCTYTCKNLCHITGKKYRFILYHIVHLCAKS